MKLKPDFGHQYCEFEEEIDLEATIFADSNHGRDKVTGKLITDLIGLLRSTPINWYAK